MLGNVAIDPSSPYPQPLAVLPPEMAMDRAGPTELIFHRREYHRPAGHRWFGIMHAHRPT